MRTITVKIETDSEESLNLIKDDIEQELSCCWNWFNKVEISEEMKEIVQCKDCKHRDAEDGLCEGRGWPMQLVPDDGFCDKGERSEE